jgi:proteasome lid subunit RPN8/RPN11
MLYLTKKQTEQLVAHTREEFPNEACGILAGVNGKVEKIYQMTNVDKSSQTFFMDPQEQLKVMKQIRNLNLEMVGIYHSHPATEAFPSAHDIELAYYPEASYVIVSIKNKDSPSIRSFKIVAGKIEEEEIKLT